MRIIAGTHRHRALLPPRDAATTRPITDRVKESLFSKLWAMGVFQDVVQEPVDDDGESPEAMAQAPMAPADMPVQTAESDTPVTALDLFAGTGSLGLEALSRGAAFCTFIERDRDARRRLEQNLSTLELANRARVLSVDAVGLSWLTLSSHIPFSVVFCDPPYAQVEDEAQRERIKAMLEALAGAPGVVAAGAVLVLRTPDKIAAPALRDWNPHDSRRYGSMMLHYYVK
ncbi:MAG: RsmD family RNA methyltransferase [Phycisphaeraceae bacterium]